MLLALVQIMVTYLLARAIENNDACRKCAGRTTCCRRARWPQSQAFRISARKICAKRFTGTAADYCLRRAIAYLVLVPLAIALGAFVALSLTFGMGPLWIAACLGTTIVILLAARFGLLLVESSRLHDL